VTALTFAADAIAALARRAISRLTNDHAAKALHQTRPRLRTATPAGFWDALTDGEREHLRTSGQISVFGRGVPVATEGDPSARVFVILSGWTKVVASTADGREAILALRGPGDVIGETSTTGRIMQNPIALQ